MLPARFLHAALFHAAPVGFLHVRLAEFQLLDLAAVTFDHRSDVGEGEPFFAKQALQFPQGVVPLVLKRGAKHPDQLADPLRGRLIECAHDSPPHHGGPSTLSMRMINRFPMSSAIACAAVRSLNSNRMRARHSVSATTRSALSRSAARRTAIKILVVLLISIFISSTSRGGHTSCSASLRDCL